MEANNTIAAYKMIFKQKYMQWEKRPVMLQNVAISRLAQAK